MALIGGNKIYRRWDIIRDVRKGRRLWPVNVELDVSNRCNLKCRWCDFAHVHDGTIMSWSQSLNIFRQLKHVGVKSITFTGGGEPTINPEFKFIVGVASGFGFNLGLYTNGVIDISEIAHRFKWIYVSLDKHRADLHEAAKGSPVFKDIIDNVMRLVSLKMADTTIGLGFLLDGESIEHIYKMVELGMELGITYVHFRPIIGLSDYGWVDLAMGVLRGVASDNIYVSWDRFQNLKQRSWPRSYEICRGSTLVPCIGANGELWVCPNTRGLRSLGNVLKNDFATIWRRRPEQMVGDDCREACRNHDLNEALEYVAHSEAHDDFI